jgi:arylsulfatase A-like enzyme
MPTLLDLAGAPVPPGIDGRSMAQAFAGGNPPEREYLYWEHNVPDRQRGGLRLVCQAVRTGRWKAVWPDAQGSAELYDLADDPSESRNLADHRQSLVRDLNRFRQQARTPPRPHDQGKMTWNT